MVWAICVCVPIASMVTMAPASSRRRSSSGIAMISLDFSDTASCPSTSCWPVAQADTVCSGPRALDRAWLRRAVFPSMAIVSGPAMRSRSTQLAKHVLNRSGSMAAITSHSMSWLGMPRPNGRKRRRKCHGRTAGNGEGTRTGSEREHSPTGPSDTFKRGVLLTYFTPRRSPPSACSLDCPGWRSAVVMASDTTVSVARHPDLAPGLACL